MDRHLEMNKSRKVCDSSLLLVERFVEVFPGSCNIFGTFVDYSLWRLITSVDVENRMDSSFREKLEMRRCGNVLFVVFAALLNIPNGNTWHIGL